MFKKLSACALFGSEEQMAHTNGVDICYETFGKKQDPAVLLIMGACAQGVIWDKVLCEKMANEGFYVIRYDHRDAGLSTCFDFKQNPYGLIDMAKDAVSVLDAAEIKQAHLFGVSMGSFIAELIAVHFPERVHTLLLLASTCEIRPMNLAFAGQPVDEKYAFSSPTDQYLAWVKEFMKLSPQTDEEKLDQRIEGWNRMNGQKIPLDAKMNREMQKTFLARLRYPQNVVNHLAVLADESSERIIRTVPFSVKVPTTILHGSEDPIFPSDHGEALARIIENSEYVLVDGMGHIPNDKFYDLYISVLKQQASDTQKNEEVMSDRKTLDNTMKKVFVSQPEKTLVGIKVRTNNKAEIDSLKGKIFPCVRKYFHESIGAQIPHRTSPGTTYCVYTDYESDHHGDYTYFIGEEVDSASDLPAHLEVLVIPAQKYVKFTNGPGSMPDVVKKPWAQIWEMTSKDLGGKRAFLADFEIYDERASDHQNIVLDIYIGIL